MNCQANKVIIYQFRIKAVSPIYFGDSRASIVKDSEGVPILLGNSIGGALRAYLKSCNVSEDIIYYYMGGDELNQFYDSKIFISDGRITDYVQILKKEGTSVDCDYGSAKQGYKYSFEYLGEGTVIDFEIEFHTNKDEEEFNKIIGTWVKGIKDSNLKLGGHQNNGFGIVDIVSLSKKEFIFMSKADLDTYIFNPTEITAKEVNEELSYYERKAERQIIFSLQGHFPYGIYQGFKDKEGSSLTGLGKYKDRYFIPASSLKGLVRNEVRILLGRFVHEDKIDVKLGEIFGDKNCKGKVVFHDVFLWNCKEISIERNAKDEKVGHYPVYIKIDRLTGGAYDKAIKRQREVCGDTVLKCNINVKEDYGQFVFPLIYVFKRIGSGQVPLGGRTSIGLGEFIGENIVIDGEIRGSINVRSKLSESEIIRFRKHYEAFERWCRDV